MKKIIPLFLLIFTMMISTVLFAQDVDVNWGIEQKHPGARYFIEVIGENADGLFTLKYKSGGDVWLEKYSTDDYSLKFSKLIFSPKTGKINVSAKTKAKYLAFEKFFFLNGRLMMFVTNFDKVTGVNTAYVQIMDNNGEPVGDLVRVDEIHASKKNNKGSFDFVFSADTTKLLVYHNDPFEKRGNERFSYKLYDKELNQVWEKNFTLPYRDRDVAISGYTLDNKGNVFMLARINLERKAKEKGEAGYYFTVLTFNEEDDEMHEYEIKLPKKYITDATFSIDKRGMIACGGFYSNKNNYEMNGTFFMRINPAEGSVISSGIKEFSGDFLREFMSDRKASKGKGLANFDFKDFLLRDDGSALMVAEQHYVVQVCNTDPRTGARSCTYQYYYNDMIVVNVNHDASIKWYSRIPKKQVSVNDGGYFSSYSLTVVGSSLHFIFNDHKKNVEKGVVTRYMDNPKKSVAVLVSLDSKGEIEKDKLFSAKELNTILRPKSNRQVNRNEMVIWGRKGTRVHKFGKITFSNRNY